MKVLFLVMTLYKLVVSLNNKIICWNNLISVFEFTIDNKRMGEVCLEVFKGGFTAYDLKRDVIGSAGGALDVGCIGKMVTIDTTYSIGYHYEIYVSSPDIAKNIVSIINGHKLKKQKGKK